MTRLAVCIGIVIAAASAILAQSRDRAPATPGVGRLSIRIVDADGRPVDRAIVEAGGRMTALGVGRPMPGPLVTGPDGLVDLPEVAAGPYTLGIRARGFIDPVVRRSVIVAPGQQAAITIRLVRAAAISGRVTDEFGTPMPGVNVTATSVDAPATMTRVIVGARAAADGRFRLHDLVPGDYLVAASFSGRATTLQRRAADGTDQSIAYLASYYGSDHRRSGARPVHVDAGSDIAGIDVVMRPTPVADIRVGLTSAGPIATTTGRLTSVQGDEISTVNAGGTRGELRFANVPAGQYFLRLESAASDGRIFGATTIGHDGRTEATIDVPLIPGRPIRGRMVFDGPDPSGAWERYISARGRAAAGSTSRHDAMPQLVEAPGVGTARLMLVSAPDSSGAFVITSIPPGVYVAGSVPPPELKTLAGDWAIAAISFAGRDVTNEPIQIDASTTGELVYTLTERVFELEGVVDPPSTVDENWVVAFPENRRYPADQGVLFSATVSSDGRFEMRGLPAATYLVALVPWPRGPLPLMAGNTAALIDLVRATGTRVVVGDAPRATVRIGR